MILVLSVDCALSGKDVSVVLNSGCTLESSEGLLKNTDVWFTPLMIMV